MNAVWALALEGGLLGPATDDRIPEGAVAALRQSPAHLFFYSERPLGEAYGTLVQAFGRSFLASGRVAIAYDRGAGVFFPGPVRTKLQRFAELDPRLLASFERARTRLFESCSAELGWSCFNYHVAGYAFSLGIRPNALEESPEAREVTAQAARFLVGHLAEAALNELPAPEGHHAAARLQTAARKGLLYEGLVADLLARDPALAGVLEAPEEVFLPPPDWLALDLDLDPGREAVLRARALDFPGALKGAIESWRLKNPRVALLAGGRHARPLLALADGPVAAPADAPGPLVEAVIQAGGKLFPPGRPEEGLDLGARSRV